MSMIRLFLLFVTCPDLRTHFHKRGRFAEIVESAWVHSNLDSLRQESKSSSGPLWENVVARITIDDDTGHIMSLEYTKHMTEKDLHRNLPSVRDIRTVLLHFSPVTPTSNWNSCSKRSLHCTETTQQTSQIKRQSWLRTSRSDCGRLCSSPSFCQLWVLMMQRSILGWRRLVMIELLRSAVPLTVCWVEQRRRRALKEDLLEKKPRVVWMTPPWTSQRKQQSQSIKKVSSSTNEHLGGVSLTCEARLVWSVKRLWNRCGVRELKAQFHSGWTPGCQWSSSFADGDAVFKILALHLLTWTLVRFAVSRRCLHDHSHQTL